MKLLSVTGDFSTLKPHYASGLATVYIKEPGGVVANFAVTGIVKEAFELLHAPQVVNVVTLDGVVIVAQCYNGASEKDFNIKMAAHYKELMGLGSAMKTLRDDLAHASADVS